MSYPTKSALVLAVFVAALGVGRKQSPGAGGAEARESGNAVPLRAVRDEGEIVSLPDFTLTP